MKKYSQQLYFYDAVIEVPWFVMLEYSRCIKISLNIIWNFKSLIVQYKAFRFFKKTLFNIDVAIANNFEQARQF